MNSKTLIFTCLITIICLLLVVMFFDSLDSKEKDSTVFKQLNVGGYVDVSKIGTGLRGSQEETTKSAQDWAIGKDEYDLYKSFIAAGAILENPIPTDTEYSYDVMPAEKKHEYKE